jgi:hypothetical protein
MITKVPQTMIRMMISKMNIPTARGLGSLNSAKSLVLSSMVDLLWVS